MAKVRKSDFQKLAKLLIGKGGVFEDMLKPCVLKKILSVSYETQSENKSTQNLMMVDTSTIESNLQLNMIKGVDIQIIGLYQELDFEPNTNDTKFSFDGITYNFVTISVDPAKATITIAGKK